MSAWRSPVGGLACWTLSILKISSRRSEGTRSPVNGESTALPPGLAWSAAGCPCPLQADSSNKPPHSIVNETAVPALARSPLRPISTAYPLTPQVTRAARLPCAPNSAAPDVSLPCRYPTGAPLTCQEPAAQCCRPSAADPVLPTQCYPAGMFGFTGLLSCEPR